MRYIKSMKNDFRKIIFLCCLLILPLGCSFVQEQGVYEQIGDTYYFEDYETMKNVIIPEINTAFKDWHWYSKKFDSKYNYYMNNIEPNPENVDKLAATDYNYAVKTGTSSKKVYLKKEKETDMDKTISGKYFWITTKDNQAVVFFMN